jgi:serine/threonine protein phosphatase 1
MTYYCIPDLHGRYDLFELAMKNLDKKPPSKIIFLGDYIDRGPDSAKIIEALRLYDGKHELVTLMGNHEQMFLEDHVYDLQTYNQLKSHKNSFHIRDWINKLELYHVVDKNIFAHAYYNANRDEQIASEVLWKRMGDFETFDLETDYYLTHGHTPRKYGPVLSPKRCNLDTCAYSTGILHIGCYEKDIKGPVDYIVVMQK